MVLNKNDIIVNEVLEFSFSVLKTLVECNENKVDKIETQIQIDENIKNMTVLTDENRLKQILLNLISNAVKFTVSGFIKIRATYNILNHSIEISIQDSGLGIKNEDHHLIFQDDVQLNLEKEYNRNGSGLGLSITKSLVNSLNHEIGFSSIFGEGSKFYLKIKCSNLIQNRFIKHKSNTARNQSCIRTLSIESEKDSSLLSLKRNNMLEREISFIDSQKDQSEKTNNIKKEESSIIPSSDDDKTYKLTPKNNMTFSVDEDIKLIRLNTNKSNDLEIIYNSFTIASNNYIDDDKFKIVIIDDNKLVRQTTINMLNYVLSNLKMNDFRVVEGCDGIDLLKLVISDKNYRIKYIFTDENMMYLNGSEAVKLIRRFEHDKKIKNYKIISVTAFDDEETRKNIISSGIDEILIKPCTKFDLLNILKR